MFRNALKIKYPKQFVWKQRSSFESDLRKSFLVKTEIIFELNSHANKKSLSKTKN